MRQRLFYGWVVLGAAFVIITMSIGTLFTLGVSLRPIEESMGWSRSGIGAIGLFNWIVMGAGGVVVLPTALLLRRPAGGQPAGGLPAGKLPFSSLSISNAGAQKWPPHSPRGAQPFPAPSPASAPMPEGPSTTCWAPISGCSWQWLFLGSFAIGTMAIVLGVTLRAPVAVPVPRPSPALGG